MNRKSKPGVRVMLGLGLLLAGLICFAGSVFAAEELTVSIPYEQVFHNHSDREDVDDEFWYQLTAQDNAPLPEGSEEERYLWSVKGNTEETLSVEMSFEKPGIYDYEVSAYVPEPQTGYTYEPRTFRISLQVTNADSGLEVGAVTVWELDGDAKSEVLTLDPAYEEETKVSPTPTAGGQSTTAPRTADPMHPAEWILVFLLSLGVVSVLSRYYFFNNQ